MALTVRNDEQIKVGTTTGLVAGSSSFTFDGTGGKPDYRNYEPVFNEIDGRGVLIKSLDYSWNYITGLFTLLQVGDVFAANRYYNIHFQFVIVPQIGDHAALINYSFFVRDITLPNIEPKTGTVNSVLERLDSFIAKYEKECLISILGYPLYKVFITENSDRMTELLFGAEYTVNSRLEKWQGIIHDNDSSLIANYIYFFERRASAIQTTGVNSQVPKGQNATVVSPRDKMVDAWNFFSSETSNMIFFLWFKKNEDGSRVYPEFTWDDAQRSTNFSRPINSLGI